MKWYKQLFAVAVLAFLGACESPTIPRYPDIEEETQKEDPDPPPTQGSAFSAEGTILV